VKNKEKSGIATLFFTQTGKAIGTYNLAIKSGWLKFGFKICTKNSKSNDKC